MFLVGERERERTGQWINSLLSYQPQQNCGSVWWSMVGSSWLGGGWWRRRSCFISIEYDRAMAELASLLVSPTPTAAVETPESQNFHQKTAGTCCYQNPNQNPNIYILEKALSELCSEFCPTVMWRVFSFSHTNFNWTKIKNCRY